MSNEEFATPAQTDAEAERRFQHFKSRDPFPEIQPALLNSSDFIDYAVTTGMIFPFNPQVGIKPASYEVNLGNEVLYWDEDNNRQYNENITSKETVVFRKNSITFVTVDAWFRLPDYIALRFNLQIHHVHRGLLLGTGPLIDPGFNGRLMIPIHNLTENDYELDKNEGLICIEFTKLSENEAWGNGSNSYTRVGTYEPNKGKKNEKSFIEYIKMHVPQRKVRSTLSATLSDTRKELEKVKGLIKWVSVGGFLGLVVLVITIYSLISDANKYVADAKNIYIEKLNESPNEVLLDINKNEMSKVNEATNKLELLLNGNKSDIPVMQAELQKVRVRLDNVQKRIEDLEKSVATAKLGN